MKEIKKIVSGILVAALAGTMLSACNEKEEAKNDLKNVVIWSNSGHDKVYMQNKVKEFNETIGKEKGLNLDYVFKEGNLDETIDLAYTSDQAPDLFNTYQVEARAQKGEIVAIDDIKGSEKLLERYGKYAMEIRHKYLGKTYILPVTSCTFGLIYNVQMFKDAGIVDENGEPKPPVTWDEVAEDAKLLTDVANQQYGIIFPGKWGGWYGTDINMASSAINGIVDGYNPKTGKFDMSGQVDIMDAMIRMKKDGSCVPGTEGLDNDPARARFGQGKIGMKIAGSYDVGVLTEQFPAKIEWAVAPLPVSDVNNKGMQYSSADGMFVVNKSSLEKIGDENIITILEYFSSDEVLRGLYEEGLSIPIDYNIIKDVEISDDLKNWKTFAGFTEFSQCPPLCVKSEVTGEKSITDIWLDIWNKEMSRDEIAKTLKDYETKMNDGIAKYAEIHPDYDPAPFIIPDWKLMR